MAMTLDASVWISAFSPAEVGHSDSRALVDLILSARAPLVEPTLFPVEIAGAVSRTRGQVLARDLTAPLPALAFIRWVALDEGLAARAAELAAAQRLRGADAVYGAVASEHGSVLVSLDQEQLTRMPPVVRTVTPSEALRLLTSPASPP
jgi:predicted nucleic acid-binding protein